MRKDQLKRRLVGALVLVSLAVIFLPMLLDKRAVEENLGAAIPGRDVGPFDAKLASELPQQPPAAAQDAPAPAVEPGAATDPNQLPAPAAGVPDKYTPEAPTAAEHPELRSWVVQVGSFGERDNADGVAARLRAAGFDTVIEAASVDGKQLYRVQVGPEASEARAELVRQRIEDTVKLKGTVRQHPAG